LFRKEETESLIVAFVFITSTTPNNGAVDSLRFVLSLLLILAIVLILLGAAIALYTFYSYIKFKASRVDRI